MRKHFMTRPPSDPNTLPDEPLSRLFARYIESVKSSPEVRQYLQTAAVFIGDDPSRLTWLRKQLARMDAQKGGAQ